MIKPHSAPRAGRARGATLVVAVALVVGTVAAGNHAGAAEPVAEARSAADIADSHLAAARADLAAAQTAVANAQERSNAAAQRLADAQARHARLSDEIVVLEREIDATTLEIADLRELVQARAVAAYMGGEASPLSLFDSDDVVDAARRVALLSSAKRQEDETLSELGRLEEDLARKQGRFESDRAELTDVIDELDSQRTVVGTQLAGAYDDLTAAENLVDTRSAEADAARSALVEAEAAAARAAEEARRAAEEEAGRLAGAGDSASESPTTAPDRQDPSASGDSDGSESEASDDGDRDGSSTTGSSMICPIDGPVAFVDSWGAPRPGSRLHEGVDIFSSKGAPNVAVVSGYVTHGIGDRQGNGVYLYGDDGNSYWYFHLDSFATGAGHVDQGDVIGYTGDTGNAAPGSFHTHFEFHPDHGGPVNPYPVTSRACF